MSTASLHCTLHACLSVSKSFTVSSQNLLPSWTFIALSVKWLNQACITRLFYSPKTSKIVSSFEGDQSRYSAGLMGTGLLVCYSAVAWPPFQVEAGKSTAHIFRKLFMIHMMTLYTGHPYYVLVRSSLKAPNTKNKYK